METGQPEAKRPETIDGPCKKRADKRRYPPPTQYKTTQSCQANIYNYKVLKRTELFEMRLKQTDSKAGVNAC
ncbi:MAG: hypothetical protein ACYSU3_16770 [Planctomycetota bacterium]